MHNWLIAKQGRLHERRIHNLQSRRTQTHTSKTHRPQAISWHACTRSKGPHRHVLDKDRQIRRQGLRLTTALALITGWSAMKETDDMYLFVFSSSALNQVNTAMPMTAKVGGTKKTTTQIKSMVVGWQFHPPHKGVCQPLQRASPGGIEKQWRSQLNVWLATHCKEKNDWARTVSSDVGLLPGRSDWHVTSGCNIHQTDLVDNVPGPTRRQPELCFMTPSWTPPPSPPLLIKPTYWQLDSSFS